VTVGAVIVSGLLLGGCSKSTSPTTESTVPSTAGKASPIETTTIANGRKPFAKLSDFKGKAPWDLVKDEVIGKEISAIVP
jgi:hypothetical protein